METWEKTIYMSQSQDDFIDKRKSDRVCLLKRHL